MVLRVENLSKTYRLGVLSRKVLWHDLARRLRGKRSDPSEEAELFWALRDVLVRSAQR